MHPRAPRTTRPSTLPGLLPATLMTLCLGITPNARAEDPTPTPAAGANLSPREEWHELINGLTRDHAAWTAEMRKKQQDNPGRPVNADDIPANRYRPRIRAFAERHTDSAPGLEALVWLVKNAPGEMRQGGELDAAWALKRIADFHLDTPGLIRQLTSLENAARPIGREPVIEFLEALITRTEDRHDRSQALLLLAIVLVDNDTPRSVERDAAEDRKKAVAILEKITRDHAGERLAEIASEVLESLTTISAGNPLPPTVGQGPDGQKIDLADYRGKVLAVVFWATWCKPCMAMIPHEKDMLEDYKDRPFALVGVNVDFSRAKAVEAITEYEITWPTIINGAPGTRGGIAERWGVRSFPYILIVDQDGIVRATDVIAHLMVPTIERLLQEAETE